MPNLLVAMYPNPYQNRIIFGFLFDTNIQAENNLRCSSAEVIIQTTKTKPAATGIYYLN